MKTSSKAIAIALAAMVAALPPTPFAFAQEPTQAEAPAATPQVPEGSVSGMGDINLYPRRIIIQGRQRTAQVGLFNRTVNEGDYEIDIREMAMTPEGRLVALEDADPAIAARVKSAKDMIRWSPKRLSLTGNESQTIRLMARPGADVAPGEYRAHFLAISRPDVTEGGTSIDEAVSGRQATGIGVTIRPRFGISIPVIVRVGETTLDLGIEQPRFVDLPDGRRALALALTRSGTRSAYGDLQVFREGSGEPIAVVRGVGIYPEIERRTIVLPFEMAEDERPLAPGEPLKVVFIDDDFEPGATLAEARFQAP